MIDITAVLGDLSTQVKVGWTIWFAWGVVLIGWYRHACVVAPVPPVTPPVRLMPTAADTTNDPGDEELTYAGPNESPLPQQ